MTQIRHQPHVPHPTIGSSRALRLSLGTTSAWSLFMLTLSVLWGSGAVPAPFGDAAPGSFTSAIDALPVPVAAGIVGFVALLSLIASSALLTVPTLRERLWRCSGVRAVGIVALAITVITTVMFTDTLLLAYLGYALSLQFPPIPPAVVWQAVMLLGPALWIIVWAVVERAFRRGGTVRRSEERSIASGSDASNAGSASPSGGSASPSVGSTSPSVGSASPAGVTTSARIAVGLAVVVPTFYALTRILWAIGIPVGLTQHLYEEGLKVGMWHSGLALALAALVGVLLTLGLVQRWGERFPRWAGPLAGRRVPITLATIPATIVTLALFTGGVGLYRNISLADTGLFAGSWATVGPTLLFPIWAIGLGWATFAYRERRLAGEARD